MFWLVLLWVVWLLLLLACGWALYRHRRRRVVWAAFLAIYIFGYIAIRFEKGFIHRARVAEIDNQIVYYGHQVLLNPYGSQNPAWRQVIPYIAYYTYHLYYPMRRGEALFWELTNPKGTPFKAA